MPHMCTDTCDVATLKAWIESYESTRMTPINEHMAVITSEYNMVHVVEWLRKYTPIAERTLEHIRQSMNV